MPDKAGTGFAGIYPRFLGHLCPQPRAAWHTVIRPMRTKLALGMLRPTPARLLFPSVSSAWGPAEGRVLLLEAREHAKANPADRPAELAPRSAPGIATLC